MATNMVHDPGNQLQVTLASTVAGEACAVSKLAGVALTSTQTDGTLTLKTDGVFLIPVLGPVALGDLLYVVNSTNVVSTVDTGVRFGYALEAIAGATTNTIKVKVGY